MYKSGLCVLFIALLVQQEAFSRIISKEAYSAEDGASEEVVGNAIMANETDIHFYLYTLEYQTDGEGQELFVGDLEGLATSNFVIGAPVKFITHGYQTGCPHQLIQGNIQAWLDLGEPVNVVCIDWKKLAALLYDVAAGHTRLVGQKTSSFIEFLVESGVTEVPDIHLQGHSLGAHVVGFAGSYSIESGAGKIPVITALDPALPLFGNKAEEDRLDPSDADFVSVVHTAGGVIGWDEPLGHADFFPNGGKKQPNCGLDIGWACSHLRAANLVIESITRDTLGFRSCKCDSWDHYQDGCTCDETALMGVHTSTEARGLYFLETTGESPFALG